MAGGDGGPVGTRSTRLIVLRGNSGSGKTSTAEAVRARRAGRVVVVSQDSLRRDLLRVPDTADGPHYAVIERTVRAALERGVDVVLEGILVRQRYAPLLTRLATAHRGVTVPYYFAVSWPETLRRHTARPEAAAFGAAAMRRWFCPDDQLDWPGERIIPETASLEETTRRVLTDLPAGRDTAAPCPESPTR